MKEIKIEKNEADQRLDRFIRKYYSNASLSRIYKMIRKDIKVNGRRASEDTILAEGDKIYVYITDETHESLRTSQKIRSSKRTFGIVYEDENILAVQKPMGLLTHGDSREKKNHLANQVITYLIENGEYNPRMEKTFVPAPANRLDRNTSGIVIFGKNAQALRLLNKMLRERGYIQKFYFAIVKGNLSKEIDLVGRMEKDEKTNKVRILPESGAGKFMQTRAVPVEHAVKWGKQFTYVEAELITGRTHQIRVQLASAGFPLVGDSKYGDAEINRRFSTKYHLSTQFLHAGRLYFAEGLEELAYLKGHELICPLTDELACIKNEIFDKKIKDGSNAGRQA